MDNNKEYISLNLPDFINKLLLYTSKHKINLFLISFLILFALIPRLLLMNHCLWVDEARDLFISRSFLHTGNLIGPNGLEYLQHPFMFYVLLSSSFAAFGVSELAGNIVVILSSLVTILAVFFIGKEISNNKWIGFGASLILSSHYLFLFYSVRILNNVPHTMFLTLAFLFFVYFLNKKENKFLYLTFLFSAFAVLTRITSFFLPLLFTFYIFYQEKFAIKSIFSKRMILSYLIFAGTFSLWMLKNLFVVGEPFDLHIWIKHLVNAGMDVAPWHYYLMNFFNIYTFVIGILFFLGIILIYISSMKHKYLLILWFASYFVVLSSVSVKVPRYVMPTLPVVAIIISLGLYLSFKSFKITKRYTLPLFILVVFLISTYALFTSYPIVSAKARGFCGFKEISEGIIASDYSNRTLFAGSSYQLSWYLNEHVKSLSKEESTFIESLHKGDLVEVDAWERTQPKYIFSLVYNNTLFKPIFGYPQNKPMVVIFEKIK